MRHISLFSGMGGFDLAAEWMGWENVAHCEWNPFCQKILKYYWPNADSLNDITKTDFRKYANTINIVSGGFPCQPYSVAGERKGKEDERHLWPHMLRSVREINPSWVLGENVRGIINWNEGMVFDEIQSDLENEGYSVQPFLLPANGQNAEHQRYRVFFVAHSERKGLQGFNTEWQNLLLHQGQAPAIIGYRDVLEEYNRSRLTGEHLRGGNGIPTGLHKESIRALGNAIVPQIAYQIFKAIELYETTKLK